METSEVTGTEETYSVTDDATATGSRRSFDNSILARGTGCQIGCAGWRLEMELGCAGNSSTETCMPSSAFSWFRPSTRGLLWHATPFSRWSTCFAWAPQTAHGFFQAKWPFCFGWRRPHANSIRDTQISGSLKYPTGTGAPNLHIFHTLLASRSAIRGDDPEI